MDIEFKLDRRFLAKTYTIGRLWLGDWRICDTLEDKVRDYNKDGDLLDAGETKVFGETAIPYGRYKVIVTYSPKFKRDLPLLLNVRHFDAIRIHSGVHELHTLGCILVGENTEKGKLSNGKYWEKIITDTIKKFIANGDAVFININ
jgi:hypothetical protein